VAHRVLVLRVAQPRKTRRGRRQLRAARPATRRVLEPPWSRRTIEQSPLTPNHRREEQAEHERQPSKRAPNDHVFTHSQGTGRDRTPARHASSREKPTCPRSTAAHGALRAPVSRAPDRLAARGPSPPTRKSARRI